MTWTDTAQLARREKYGLGEARVSVDGAGDVCPDALGRLCEAHAAGWAGTETGKEAGPEAEEEAELEAETRGRGCSVTSRCGRTDVRAPPHRFQSRSRLAPGSVSGWDEAWVEGLPRIVGASPALPSKIPTQQGQKRLYPRCGGGRGGACCESSQARLSYSGSFYPRPRGIAFLRPPFAYFFLAPAISADLCGGKNHSSGD